MNVSYEKIQIILSIRVLARISTWKKDKVRTQWSQPQGPPGSATLPKADPVQPTLTEHCLQSGTGLGAAEIKVRRWHPPAQGLGRAGKQTCTHDSNTLTAAQVRATDGIGSNS